MTNLKIQFVKACSSCLLDVLPELDEKVKLLRLTNPILANEILATGVSDAIEEGHLDVIKYLVQNNNQEFKLNALLDPQAILYVASIYDQVNIIKYIVEENKLKKLNINADETFENAYQQGFMEVLRVLIFDYNIQKNSVVNKCLDFGFGIDEDVENMFKLRELNKSLNEELSNNQIKSSVNKLKI